MAYRQVQGLREASHRGPGRGDGPSSFLLPSSCTSLEKKVWLFALLVTKQINASPHLENSISVSSVGPSTNLPLIENASASARTFRIVGLVLVLRGSRGGPGAREDPPPPPRSAASASAASDSQSLGGDQRGRRLRRAVSGDRFWLGRCIRPASDRRREQEEEGIRGGGGGRRLAAAA